MSGTSVGPTVASSGHADHFRRPRTTCAARDRCREATGQLVDRELLRSGRIPGLPPGAVILRCPSGFLVRSSVLVKERAHVGRVGPTGHATGARGGPMALHNHCFLSRRRRPLIGRVGSHPCGMLRNLSTKCPSTGWGAMTLLRLGITREKGAQVDHP